METSKEVSNVFQFLKLVGHLKHVDRTGWVMKGIPKPETISGHMYRMAIMAFLLEGSETNLNIIKCMKMALVHDLAECVIGDITPKCGVSPEVKKEAEMKAMKDICVLVGPPGAEMLKLFEEYEERDTVEAKTVKDMDIFDMILQAFEYENENELPEYLQEFFDSTVDHVYTNPLIEKLNVELRNRRELAIQAQSNVTGEGEDV